VVGLRSSLQPTHDAMSSRFFRDVHHPRHWTAAAHGCLKPAPASRLRRVLLHLWYGIALHERVLGTTSRKSSIFLWRKVGVVFMRVNSKCAHQVRPPLTQTRGGQRSVNIGKHLAPTRDPPLGAVHSGGPLRQPAVLSFGSPSPGHNIAPAFQPLAATGDFTLELVSEQTRHLANHPSTALGTSP